MFSLAYCSKDTKKFILIATYYYFLHLHKIAKKKKSIIGNG